MESVRIPVSQSIGEVTGLLNMPADARCLLTLAHGAGAGMSHPFMEQLAQALAVHRIGTIRFNFPFTEHGKKRPDPAPVAEKTVGAVIRWAEQKYSKIPLFVSGKSFGGRMSSHFLSVTHDTTVRGIIFYGFPLHAAGDPGTSRAGHLATVKVPMLFLQGTRDTLADLGLITKVCSGLAGARLKTFEGADHSFKAGKKVIISELAFETNEWISEKIN